MDKNQLSELISKKTGSKVDIVDFVINNFNEKLINIILEQGDLKVNSKPYKIKKFEIVKSSFKGISYFTRKQIMTESENSTDYHYIYFNSPSIDKEYIKLKLNPDISKRIIKYTSSTKKEYRYVN